MSNRPLRSWTPRSARTGRVTSAPLSFRRPSSRCSTVESNFRVDTPSIPEVTIQTRAKRTREITINDSPMMLLPKARVRESMDYYDNFRRPYAGVLADTETQGLHISTIQSVTGMQTRVAPKSAMKARRLSISRSEADSGFCSLKRSVTFDNLSRSQSTVFRSDDEYDNLSETSSDEKDESDSLCYRLPHLGAENDATFPEHLESFGKDTDEPVLANDLMLPPRPPSRASHSDTKSRRRHGDHDGHDVNACEICGVVLSDNERVEKSFGKVDTFLDWVMSKWGRDYQDALRTELQYMPRPSYVFRGHKPHFCNFVHQVQLHSKQSTTADSTGLPESEIGDEIDFVLESAEGRLLNKYRKSSNASSTSESNSRGLTKSPRLEDYDKMTNRDVQNWLAGKKYNKSLVLKYFSSIPEIKEDNVVSGTEGRPGSPSSLDGDSKQDGEDQRQHVTEVRVSSPVKVDTMPKPVKIEPEKPVSGRGDHQAIPEEKEDKLADKPLNAWNNDKSTDSVVVPREDSNLQERVPSPSEPPPSPDLSKKADPVPPTSPPGARKRGCVTKKTKKPIERARKMKPIEEPKDVAKPEPEPVLTNENPEDNSEAVEVKVDLKVPDLPSEVDKKEGRRKEKTKVKRHLIETEDDLHKHDTNDLLNNQMKLNHTDFDWSNMDTNGTEDVKRQPQVKNWIQGRLALSQQSSRFELPMDMKNLERMTPQEYIKKHCIITSRRQNLYQKIFLKNKDKSQTILFKDLDKSLKDVLVNTITTDQISGILKALEVDENTKIDYKLFAGLAAYAERVLYPRFVTEEYLNKLIELEIAFGLLGTEDTHDMPEYQREKIECADFCALDWKIHGVKISPEMLHVLREIC